MILSLSTAVVLNENRRSEVAGDVTLFRNISDLLLSIEPVDVKNGEYTAYTLTGNRIDLSVENDQVKAKLTTENDFSPRVRYLLEAMAEHVLKTRRRGNTEEFNPKAMSIEALTELIGFTR